MIALLLCGVASACSMVPQPVCHHWDASTHVILAEVLGPVEPVPGGKSAKSHVLKTWKGNTGSEWITIQTMRGPCLSDELQAGEKIVLFGNSLDNLTIHAGWRRAPLKAAKRIGDIEYLDAMAFGNWFERQLGSLKACVYSFWMKR